MSVYATNRIASIAEGSEISQEIMEAFADKTRETANLSCYGVIAQIHENDQRMFDAIISADFASASHRGFCCGGGEKVGQRLLYGYHHYADGLCG